MDGSEAPLDELIQQAVTLREAHDKPLRSGFDNLPPFLQNTLVVSDEVKAARELPFEERLRFAVGQRVAGNAHFKEGRLFDAVHCYEEALAVFRFLENKNAAWRTKGIQDTDIVRHDHVSTDEPQAACLREFYASCYVNIAIALFKMGDYNQCIQACDAAISEAPDNAKAFFKRAQARVASASAGATDTELALQDLSVALKLAPNDAAVQKEYKKLKRERAAQVAKEKRVFGKIFDRQSLDEGDDNEGNGKHARSPQSQASVAHGAARRATQANLMPWVVGITAGVGLFLWRIWATGLLEALLSRYWGAGDQTERTDL